MIHQVSTTRLFFIKYYGVRYLMFKCYRAYEMAHAVEFWVLISDDHEL
jgi:hypothetical protein